MAVAETASTIHGQPRTRPSQAGPAQSGWGARFSWLSLLLALAMNTVAHAQILADRNAPRHQQATVLGSASGVPVVNIQTPNRAGLSVNMYRQFDVGSNGVVLNNARTTTQSQLAGYVPGNPWLATGAARVIVNQVNSSHPSYLRGFIEVAGASAQVIIAKRERDSGESRLDSPKVSEVLSSIFCLTDLFNPNDDRESYELDEEKLRSEIGKLIEQAGLL